MTFSETAGWTVFRRETGRQRTPLLRKFGMLACLAVSLAPLQSSAAQKNAETRLARMQHLSLAEREIRSYRASGLSCRSRFDGSNADAVRLVKAQSARPDSYEHVETQVWPVRDGQNAFAMTYTLEDSAGHRDFHRAFGRIDNATCKASLTHS